MSFTLPSDHYIQGSWVKGKGAPLDSLNPASEEVVYTTKTATQDEVDLAISSAADAFESWAARSIENRISQLEKFAEILLSRKEELAEAISKETGKPLWESRQEVSAMQGKVAISIDAYKDRCPTVRKPLAHGASITRHKPHGVVVVIGPYNFPGHLPNGHIVPALLAGNTVVFKPSELTPLTAALTIDCWIQSGLPRGVLNMVQGGHETGAALLDNPRIDGVFFTGSANTGKTILNKLGPNPEKILALEMGGNNPLIISSFADIKTACCNTILSAFLTSGQRCTCARSLILIESPRSQEFVQELTGMIKGIRVGVYTETPEPFMGPLINNAAAKRVLGAQVKLHELGGIPLVEATGIGSLLTPGLIDVTHVKSRPDDEIFGPLLQLIRVKDLNEAIKEANNTRYGLSAGIFTESREEYDLFFRKIKAGVINWNTPLTGASSAAPFGGLGISGNHRPSAYYAADYCASPIASLENEKLIIPATLPPGIKI